VPVGIVVDTNVVIRFLTKTPADQYQRAFALMERANAGEIDLRLSAAVVAEVAAVLHHLFKRPQDDVAGTLLELVSARGVIVEEEDIVRRSLEHSRELKDIDFIDAYVAVKARDEGLPVASFDKNLHKRLGTNVFPL
jgi:predicted nucleic-acid-binding protein